MKHLVGCILFFLSYGYAAESFANSQECVILIHGLARTEKSMLLMKNELSAKGYHVVNEKYASRRQSIEQLAVDNLPKWVDKCKGIGKAPIHFIAHSMGGILLRYYLEKNNIEHLGHVVMLGPPNQGSEVVDKLKFIPGFYFINGPAGRQLGTSKKSIPKQLNPVTFKLGVIAGNRSMNLLLSLFLPNPDDGKVSVASTRVEGMCSFVSLPVTHPFLMKKKAVIKEALHFLEHGEFRHQNAENELCRTS